MIRDLLKFGRRAPHAVAPVIQPASRKTVLIIEDRSDSLRAMCLALAGDEYLIETAETAGAALRKIAAAPPELILLDTRVLAPDGTSLAHRLLADEELASVWIVALTQISSGTDGAHRPIGAYDGHVPKTTEAGDFAGQVRELLRLSSTQPPLTALDLDIARGAGTNGRLDVSTLLDSIEKGLPDSQFAPGTREALRQLAAVVVGFEHYELAGYLQRAERLSSASTVRGRSRYRLIVRLCREIIERDPDAAPEMADLRASYLGRRRAEVHVLEQALQERDFVAISKTGHNLKGTGAAYGYGEISDIGRSLEAAAKDADACAIEILLGRIDSYLDIVRRPANTGAINA